MKKTAKKAIPGPAKVYEEQLVKEINEYCEEHGKRPFDGLYDRLITSFPKIKAAVLDAGYKTPWICKEVLDDKQIPVLPYKRPMDKDAFYRPYEYISDLLF